MFRSAQHDRNCHFLTGSHVFFSFSPYSLWHCCFPAKIAVLKQRESEGEAKGKRRKKQLKQVLLLLQINNRRQMVAITIQPFAAAVGAGLKYGLDINGSKCYLGIEADYEFGLTNTYSKKERDGEVIINSGLLYPAYNITGSRKFKGFELRASLSVPFSIFKKKQKPAPAPIVAAPVEPEPEPVVEVEEKPCYTLDEILSLISLGERVEGKTICAIDIIHFDFGKSSIKPSSYDYLNKIASLIIRTNVNMEIKGHTDNVGTPEFNMNLSKQRAEAVYDYLVGHGVSKSRLSYSYYGMTRPLGDNDTEEGRTMNRRVEFEIK